MLSSAPAELPRSPATKLSDLAFSLAVYIDLGRGTANRVVLSIITNGMHISRTWKIKISQIPCGQLSMAPSGCMQYYRSPSDVIKSFNYEIDPNPAGGARYLANLRYTSCIRLEEVLFLF